MQTKLKVVVASALLITATLSTSASPVARAAYPGSNGRIAFASFPRNSTPWEEIYTIRPDGTGLLRITTNNGNRVGDVHPAWSPNGKRIAMVRVPYNADSEIRIIKPNGALVSTITNNSVIESSPTWSPDGTKLAFQRGFPADIYVRDLTTGTTTQITSDPASDELPVWSPLGDKIAFAREFDNGAYYQIYTVDVDTSGIPSNEVNVSNDATYSDYSPDWSPDGTQLVISRWKPSWNGNEIALMTLATGNVQRLTVNKAEDYSPAFAPSGTRIVWSRGPEEGDTELMIRNMTTGNVTTLTSNNVVDQQADWQPIP